MTEISEHDKAVILAEADELKVTVAAYSSDSIDTLGLLAFWLEGVYGANRENGKNRTLRFSGQP